METMSHYPITPQTQTSHMRHSLMKTNAAIAQEATRSMQAAEAETQQLPPPHSIPASQESNTSVQSSGSSVAPRLQGDSSNVSQLTDYTDLTSPTSSAPKKQNGDVPSPARSASRRQKTPEESMGNGNGHLDYALASPMSVTSPYAANGAKRTASGHVKNAPSVPTTPYNTQSAGRRSRAESLSSTGSRAGELAASLKARLGYAMVKVQNGWEHKSLDEVEQLAAQRVSPNRHSMSHLDYSRRPTSSGLSNGTARLSMYESSHHHHMPTMNNTTSPPPSKRHSGTFVSYSQQVYASPNTTVPRLQPPVDLRPTAAAAVYSPRHRQQPTPSSQGSRPNYGHAMSPPRTPMHSQRRPPTIRTDTQTAEAERDALQALFQLGSPHASQGASRYVENSRKANNASQASSSQASPLRSEFATTPRRVTFARSESEGSSIGVRAASSSAEEDGEGESA